VSAQNPMMASATQNDSSLPRWKPSARQVIEGLLGLSLAVALLVWGLPFFVGITWAEVLDKLRQVGPSTALQLLAVMISGLWLYTFMLTGSLPGLSHPKALILNVSSSSVGNLLPGGGAAGVAATYGMCRSWGFSRRDISTSVIVSGVWNVLGRVALPVIGTGVLLTDASEAAPDRRAWRGHRRRGGRGSARLVHRRDRLRKSGHRHRARSRQGVEPVLAPVAGQPGHGYR